MTTTHATDFIVAGPPGEVTAGPAGSFKAGPPGQIAIGQPGHVPIDTSAAHGLPANRSIPNFMVPERTGGDIVSDTA
ncbi:hypothetical protein GO013_01745 [Pseudodesulfovibrio sp. JC047]|uniref:hypothetical protein n=1 Tax=Pseudodesulfovibrio sp. JC047 TaxID=2683199 RepID=UPI0013D7E81A|nr:hypothetical protein [Pseudodesulfovibrio sp. JC047]NDV18141.1 hypothetical protein [Pseudodesulfovibrio sp. JC047]